MRQAKIYYDTTMAGQLTETDDGEYVFQYNPQYITSYPEQFITFSMPIRSAPHPS